MSKQLIIVCGDSEKKYAMYLQQLVSARDDKEGEQIGTKDGAVNAVIWSEKQYEDNLIKLNSTNNVLFIGDSKLAKMSRENMDVKFNITGMSYGWLGNQAFMNVKNNSLTKENFGEFQELCEKYGKSFEKKLSEHYSPKELKAPEITTAVQTFADGSVSDNIKLMMTGAATGAVVGLAILYPVITIAALGGKAALDQVGNLLTSGKAHDRQYNLLTLIMYMDGLPQFLEV